MKKVVRAILIGLIFSLMLPCQALAKNGKLYVLIICAGIMENNIPAIEKTLSENLLYDAVEIHEFHYKCYDMTIIGGGTTKNDYDNAIKAAMNGIGPNDTAIIYHNGHSNISLSNEVPGLQCMAWVQLAILVRFIWDSIIRMQII